MLSYNSSLSESDMKVFMTAILLDAFFFFKKASVYCSQETQGYYLN